MVSMDVKRELFKKILENIPRIREVISYGIPHLIGEITEDDVCLDVLTYEGREVEIVIKESSRTCFIIPIRGEEDLKAYRLFARIISHIQEDKRKLNPGMKIKGDILGTLKKFGHEILWMSDWQGSVELITICKGKRYRLLLRRDNIDEYTLTSILEL
ncbi:hypothetical protein [Pyrococcus abyssi]|uniref:Uncharacterized protein n=1 Tax=Pyrococcus abyssi (strain GE5 / Orsay) TaxID=272844 RepID=Q9UYS9_PYRAB|nr:hypothetical protein [Pyrococcus abyssi]CAB50333.1 Hypothetical protein PAB2372 [Pyrococcus abyssi GE5]CCE70873.1 TPA: hypothetical protein PAB2372 [Pyrococcus abyssi GE5]